MSRPQYQSRILRHLETYGSITSLEAIELYGCTRLSAVIYNLKAAGLCIEKETEAARNRYDEKSYFARYRLIPKT